MYCKFCGSELDENQVCPKCGDGVNKVDVTCVETDTKAGLNKKKIMIILGVVVIIVLGIVLCLNLTGGLSDDEKLSKATKIINNTDLGSKYEVTYEDIFGFCSHDEKNTYYNTKEISFGETGASTDYSLTPEEEILDSYMDIYDSDKTKDVPKGKDYVYVTVETGLTSDYCFYFAVNLKTREVICYRTVSDSFDTDSALFIKILSGGIEHNIDCYNQLMDTLMDLGN